MALKLTFQGQNQLKFIQFYVFLAVSKAHSPVLVGLALRLFAQPLLHQRLLVAAAALPAICVCRWSWPAF